MMIARVVLFSGALLMAAGCGPTTEPATFIRTMNIRRPPKPHGGHVRVFAVGKPPRPYVSIGILTIQEESYARALYFVRREAARHGCDGIIPIGSASVPTGATRLPFGMVKINRAIQARFACIVWRAPQHTGHPATLYR